jgi:hypothetical protein
LKAFSRVKSELQLDVAQQEQLRWETDSIAKTDADIKKFSDEGQGIVKRSRIDR